LIDVVIAEKAKLFISAIGVPPVDVVKKLHDAGIIVMNVSDVRLAAHSWEHDPNQMVGHPKHVSKALAAGVRATSAPWQCKESNRAE
jgi:hypothetical protein